MTVAKSVGQARAQHAESFRLGIVGAGVIARKHVDAIQAVPGAFSVSAVCDSNPVAARALAEQSACAHVYASHNALCAAGGLDAVIIASPHDMHFDMAMAFVEAGIPVLVEKPLTCTLEQLRALDAAARRNEVLVVAGQMRRFEREAVWVHRRMSENPELFGQLRSFDIQSWQNIRAYTGPSGLGHWLLDGRRAGGGVVISLAVHQLDLLRYLAGCDFAEVTAHGRFDAPFHGGGESSASVLFRMSNGAVGTLHATYNAPRVPFCESMTMFGENGTITQLAERIGDYRGPIYFSSELDSTTSVFQDQYKGFMVPPESEVKDLHENRFVNQIVHFARAVRGEATARNSIAENFNTIACVEAVAQSLTNGGTVEVARP